MVGLTIEGCCANCEYMNLDFNRVWAGKNLYSVNCIHENVCFKLIEEIAWKEKKKESEVDE